LDAAEWVRTRLDLPVDELQARVLRTASKRGILNCSRQWGKSTITAAKAVHQALHEAESLTVVVRVRASPLGVGVTARDMEQPAQVIVAGSISIIGHGVSGPSTRFRSIRGTRRTTVVKCEGICIEESR
jgi:hypothetical protein